MMWSLRYLALLVVVTGLRILCMASMHASEGLRLSATEARRLLVAISKLAPVTVIGPSPFERIHFPHVCWLDSPAFRPLGSVLARYPGAFRWVVLGKPPRRCLQIEPNTFAGESPFYGIDPKDIDPRDVETLASNFDIYGIGAPWRNSPAVDPTDYRSRVIQELPSVAKFLEQEMTLENQPSLGIATSTKTLELPEMEDHEGPRAVVLAKDPERYAFERVPTSELDRMVHYWISEDEERMLTNAMAAVQPEYDKKWPLLAQIGEAHYGGAAIKPEDVPRLRAEAETFSSMTHDSQINDALRRVTSITRSAQKYGLGIFVSGQ